MPVNENLINKGRLTFSIPPKLSQEEENLFQNWVKSTPWWQDYYKQYGEYPELDYNRSGYDYRSAWKSGIKPSMDMESKTYHWGSYNPVNHSLLKAPWHETLMKELENWPIESWPENYINIIPRENIDKYLKGIK